MANTSPKRQRGAQPNNKNALKHGFYSNAYQVEEIDDLQAYVVEGITEEVALMRVFMRRVAEMAKGDTDLNQMISTLSVIGLVSSKIASLLRVQHILYGEDTGVAAALSTALDEVLKEMGRGK